MRAQITHRLTLDGILSASALERIGTFWYIAGDDASELYRLDDAFRLVGTTPLVQAPASGSPRTTKAAKLDLEAMTAVAWRGRNELLAFGSGSKTPERDFCFRTDITDPGVPRLMTQASLTALYDVLRAAPEFVSTQKLNLEAAAATGDELYLFQRGNISGNNALAAYDLAAFMQFLAGQTNVPPPPRIARFTLPALQNRNSGFSAATLLNDAQILFAATVEDTDNEIDDGATLGSFIGMLERRDTWRVLWTAAVTESDNIVPVKIEGLALLRADRHVYQCAAVTDSDGEPSELLHIECTGE